MTSNLNLLFANVFGLDSLVIVILILVFVFGPRKLSDLGKGLGEGIRNFKSAMDDHKNDEEEKKK